MHAPLQHGNGGDRQRNKSAHGEEERGTGEPHLRRRGVLTLHRPGRTEEEDDDGDNRRDRRGGRGAREERERERAAAVGMAEERALAPAEGPEDAPLDAAAMRSRVEQLSLKHRRRGVEEAESGVGDAEVMLCLDTAYQVAQEGMDVLDPSTAAISIDDLDALELLRKEVALAEEDMIHLDADCEVIESLLQSKVVLYLCSSCFPA
ncbi:hypothetical protein HU200_036140 [Digitaria exilis]|uniref:Uncharacterized protein n=1 Tax=Digitaria exilis TaxID=1010633 RepID=A0A835BH79_9POAL|nr:hypothetical protein HU200_036140 [Digitaria exilis]